MLGWILLGGLAYGATCLAAGVAALRALRVEVNRLEAACLGFAAGAAIVSTLTLGLALLFLARKGVFLGIAALALVSCAWLRPWFRGLKPASWRTIPAAFRILLSIACVVYGGLYFLHALQPAMCPDTYHLGFASLWNKAHGMTRIVDCYAVLPQGLEMLYLFAFAIGRHSAAVLVHYLFLMALPLAMVLYGMRFGMNRGAAAFAAIVVFVTPFIGWDGSVAYNDIALAVAAFATLYLLQVWRSTKGTGALLAAGLVAGFCVAIKYTGAFIALALAGTVVWELRRKPREAAGALLLAGLAAALPAAPYFARNWIWYRDPVAFFFNSIFPNPNFSVFFERGYVQNMAHHDGVTWAQIPRGLLFSRPNMYYSLGPIYALAPIALLAAFWEETRLPLLFAFMASLPFIWNKDPRFLMPALPFVMLAVGFLVSRIPRGAWALWLVAALQVLLMWPSVMKHTEEIHVITPSLADTDWRAALRLKPEDQYLAQFDEFWVARYIQRLVPPGGTVLALAGGVATSYTDRFILDSYHSAVASRDTDFFYNYGNSARDPRWRWRATWPSADVREVKIVQQGKSENQWYVSEARLLAGEGAIPLSPGEQWEAHPDPWDAGLLSDGWEASRWYSREAMRPGMWIGLRLNHPLRTDSVEVVSTNAPWESKLEAQVWDAAGRRVPVNGQWIEDPPLDMRTAATRWLKLQGIDYVLIDKDGFNGEALLRNAAAWGLQPLALTPNATLFQIQ